MNASLQKLVKNLSDDYSKYLTEELGSKNLDLLKQKDSYPYEYTDSFKRWNHQILRWNDWFEVRENCRHWQEEEFFTLLKDTVKQITNT